jgi:septum formation protein
MPNIPIILASTSPRRKELLALLKIPFEIVPPTISEEVQGQESAVEHVRRLAFEKARSVALHFPENFVIGSDTIIDLNGNILSKPKDLEEARAMLTQLRGRCHLVHTGLAFVAKANQLEKIWVETVKVWIRDFSDAVVQDYLKTQDSLGKAGAYSIQGKGTHLIEKIDGDYPAVVGLPLRQTARFLEEAGFNLPKNVEDIYRTKPYANWKDFG